MIKQKPIRLKFTEEQILNFCTNKNIYIKYKLKCKVTGAKIRLCKALKSGKLLSILKARESLNDAIYDYDDYCETCGQYGGWKGCCECSLE